MCKPTPALSTAHVRNAALPAISDSQRMEKKKRIFWPDPQRFTKKGVPRNMREPSALLTGLEALRWRR